MKSLMRVLIHAGTHKTGTTSIQKVLLDNTEVLAEHGVSYPLSERYKTKHHRFAHDTASSDPKRIAAARAFVGQALAAFGAEINTLVISAEPIYRHVDGTTSWENYSAIEDYWHRRRTYLKRLNSFFEGHDVEALLVLRRREEFMHSLYNELTKKGDWSGSKEEFDSKFRVLGDYKRQIDMFRSAFATVTVLDYNRSLQNGSILPSFFRRIGVPLPDGAEQVWENASK